MKKIAFIAGVFFPDAGGAQVQCHNVANQLSDMGFKVDCYTFKKTSNLSSKYTTILINRVILKLVFISNYYLGCNLDFILTFYLKRIIKKKSYDTWHFHFINYKSLLIINSLKKLNQKIFVTFQGIDIQINKEIKYGYRLNPNYQKLLNKTLNKIDIFFNISQTIKEDLINLGVEDNKIIFFPYLVKTEKFQELIKEKKKNNKIKLVTIARYAPKKKGYDFLPLLADILIKKSINFEWTIVGSGTSELKKNHIIKKNFKMFNILENIDNKDEMYFPHSKLIHIYNESDLYINLARVESFGITFIEALASGIPIITFDSLGANEIILNNKNGIIIKEWSLNRMAIELLNLMNDNKKLKEMKNNCLNDARRYSLKTNLEKLKYLY